jgi:hypothetical protein
MVKLLKRQHQPLLNNASEPQKKDQDARIKQPNQTVGAIYINN